jgi:hypothetical protein
MMQLGPSKQDGERRTLVRKFWAESDAHNLASTGRPRHTLANPFRAITLDAAPSLDPASTPFAPAGTPR